jgi:molybdenum cofactor cytidylyltransferase
MGQSKQLLSIDGKPMVRWVAESVCQAGMAQVVVVTGAGAPAVARALEDLPVEIVVNEAWTTGLSGSVRVGILALRPEIQAAVLVLADQPGLTADLIKALLDRYTATSAPIVVPVFEGKRGNPVLFDRMLFQELLQIEGDQGGRQLIERAGDRVERVTVVDPAGLIDVDTPADFRSVASFGIEEKVE